jgi:two-component system sensor histidine kinase PhoQ
MVIARSDVIWEGIGRSETRYTFLVMESNSAVNKAIKQFRYIVWRWLSVAAILIIVIQYFLLRWGMQPLRQVTIALQDIEAGKTEKIEGAFPPEIKPLTDNINFFIQSEREQRKRYGESMANLAHSLKTPLAVLHTITEREKQIDTLRQQVRDQVIRMNDIVRYQLQRAVTKGRTPLSATTNIAPLLNQIIQAMEKVHGFHRGVRFDLLCPDNVRFVGETGDLVELLGNLLDNAGKWAKTQVRCHVSETKISAGRHALHISVEDDGPGIDKEKRPTVLGRGERLDEKIEGQGIGLSVVAELVAAYQGKLSFGTSPEFGGAWIHIELPL